MSALAQAITAAGVLLVVLGIGLIDWLKQPPIDFDELDPNLTDRDGGDLPEEPSVEL